MSIAAALIAFALQASPAAAPPGVPPQPTSQTLRWTPAEADFIARDVRFCSGQALPEVRLHYATLGTPHRNAAGEIDNAVMLLHGTGGAGLQFLQPQFANELFGPGQPLDVRRYWIILPDNVGHGRSSKPSDGLRMRFPNYDYDDMVRLQHRLLTEGLGVRRLRLLLGTSMGCMHAVVWGETFPDFAQALMPLACEPVEIAGLNRMWRQLVIDGVKSDPAWNGANTARNLRKDSAPPPRSSRSPARRPSSSRNNIRHATRQAPRSESASPATWLGATPTT